MTPRIPKPFLTDDIPTPKGEKRLGLRFTPKDAAAEETARPHKSEHEKETGRAKIFLAALGWVLFVSLAVVLGLRKEPAATPNANETSANAASPSPMPAVSEETGRQEEIKSADKMKAVKEFVAKNYNGWQLIGTSNGFNSRCRDALPCKLHIAYGKKDRVLTVEVDGFRTPTDERYWLVYEEEAGPSREKK